MNSDAAAQPIHLTPEEWTAIGRQLRDEVGRADLGRHMTTPIGRDPLAVLRRAAASSPPPAQRFDFDSMSASPFAFLRGAGPLMAADLAASPVTGLTVLAVGDACLANFTVVATPDHELVVDIVDYRDALLAPWEWDVKRLVVSVALAAGTQDGDAAAGARRAARAYRRALRTFTRARVLDLWRFRVDGSRWVDAADKARRRAASDAGSTVIAGVHVGPTDIVEASPVGPRFASLPPVVTPARDLDGEAAGAVHDLVQRCFTSYRANLPAERRHLLDRFRLVDVAALDEGRGSTIAVLVAGRSEDDLLVLRLEEARASALEPFGERGADSTEGERIVNALRLLADVEDPLAGASSPLDDGRQYYWRQHRTTATVGELPADARELNRCAVACARRLAHAHARSGDAQAIAAYLGSGSAFDKAIAAFAPAYAGQVRRDWEAFRAGLDGD
jgi:uncharacterized protein (DUF2252 family)